MKRIHSYPCVLVIVVGLIMLPGQLSAQVYETYTIKNTSITPANDLHLVIVNSDCVAEPVSQARSSAFDDPPEGENTNTIDWNSDGGGEVPPGSSDQISICNEDHNFYLFKAEGTHFTHDGVPINTEFVTLKFGMHIDRDGLASLGVESGEGGDVVAAVAVYGGNSLANFSIGDKENPYEEPTGELIFSKSLQIVAGSTQSIPLGPFDPSGYGLILAQIERVETPGDTFFQASGFYPDDNEVCILELRNNALADGMSEADRDQALFHLGEATVAATGDNPGGAVKHLKAFGKLLSPMSAEVAQAVEDCTSLQRSDR